MMTDEDGHACFQCGARRYAQAPTPWAKNHRLPVYRVPGEAAGRESPTGDDRAGEQVGPGHAVQT